MVIAIIAIAGKLWEYRESINVEVTFTLLVNLFLACILYAIVVYMCPLIYKNTLYITSNRSVEFYKVANIYCKSNIYKYLPGNVMQYVGRNEIAVKEDVGHSKAAIATIIEIGVTFLSAILLTCIVSYDKAIEWISIYIDIDLKLILIAIGVVATLVIVGILIIKRFFNELYKSVFNPRAIILLVGTTLYSSLILLLNSLLYYYVLWSLGIHLSIEGYWVGIGLYALSFVLGYITPGVPGGIGIREAIMVYFFSAYIVESEILTGAVIFRMVSIIGDFMAYILSMVIDLLKRRSLEC